MAQNRMVLIFALAILALGGQAFAQSRPSDAELAQSLRAGGYVIAFATALPTKIWPTPTHSTTTISTSSASSA